MFTTRQKIAMVFGTISMGLMIYMSICMLRCAVARVIISWSEYAIFVSIIVTYSIGHHFWTTGERKHG
jgi:hypothetical protein